jgi:hypothetical protein
MGSNASKSTSAYSVRNYSTILRNSNAFKLGDLDVSERHLLLELTVDFLMYTCLRICLRSVLIGGISRVIHRVIRL